MLHARAISEENRMEPRPPQREGGGVAGPGGGPGLCAGAAGCALMRAVQTEQAGAAPQRARIEDGRLRWRAAATPGAGPRASPTGERRCCLRRTVLQVHFISNSGPTTRPSLSEPRELSELSTLHDSSNHPSVTPAAVCMGRCPHGGRHRRFQKGQCIGRCSAKRTVSVAHPFQLRCGNR